METKGKSKCWTITRKCERWSKVKVLNLYYSMTGNTEKVAKK
ncbi:MAG: hypothetical protein Q6352_006890 [Candidatus Freyrarchaeum guaymaensis]